MRIETSEFKNGGSIPEKFTCKGEGINPALQISEVPPDAKSLALIMEDPDAPSGTFIHWLVWNISTSTNAIGENDFPSGAVAGANTSGSTSYRPPCPPSGKPHRYIFRLYALDNLLDLTEGASRTELDEAMKGHIISESQLTGLFGQ